MALLSACWGPCKTKGARHHSRPLQAASWPQCEHHKDTPAITAEQVLCYHPGGAHLQSSPVRLLHPMQQLLRCRRNL